MNENNTLTHADPALEETLSEEEATWSPYDSAPVSSDQRQSYRYPAQPGRDVATLRDGRNTRNAQLCEESAGGMAVEVTGKTNLKVNDEVDIGIYTGWYRARVVHVKPIEGGHRIGLQRISIITNEGDNPRRKGEKPKTGQVRNLIAVGFVAMALGVGVTSYFGGWRETKRSAVHSGIQFSQPDSRIHGVLDGVNLLLEPEVAKGLKLSEGQQQSIEGVLIGASNSLGVAYEESRYKPPQVWYAESQNIVNGALENILCSLTDEQVIKWRALMVHRRKAQPEN